MGAMGLGQLDPTELQDVAGAMLGSNMLELGPEAAIGMFETIGANTVATDFTGDQLGGLIGALEPSQIGESLTPDVLLEAAGKMTIDHFHNVGGDQAAAMVETLGFDQVLELGGEQVAGMFSAMAGEQ